MKWNRTIALTIAATLVTIAVGPVAVADAPAGRYAVSNGTVKDEETGLVWRQTEQPGGPFALDEAKTQCAAPWRLPTVQELRTIADLTENAAPTIDRSVFQGPTAGSAPSAGWFWSSTPYLLEGDSTFYVSFDSGYVDAKPATMTMGVRCVQGG